MWSLKHKFGQRQHWLNQPVARVEQSLNCWVLGIATTLVACNHTQINIYYHRLDQLYRGLSMDLYCQRHRHPCKHLTRSHCSFWIIPLSQLSKDNLDWKKDNFSWRQWRERWLYLVTVMRKMMVLGECEVVSDSHLPGTAFEATFTSPRLVYHHLKRKGWSGNALQLGLWWSGTASQPGL